MAFAPDYPTSGRFYVFITEPTGGNSGGDIRIDEYRRSGTDLDRADSPTRRTLFRVEHSSRGNHYGGGLAFGPDGLLYVSVGDGGGGDDPDGNAQDGSTLLGKLLRVDGRQLGAQAQVFAKGLRNPFRFSFDRQTGDLTLGDVGQDDVEEIDFLGAGTGPGTNFGWPCFEGTAANDGAPPGCTAPGHAPPVIDRPSAADSRSIIGGVVVRDNSLGSLAGRYLYADFFDDELRSAVVSAGGSSDDGPSGIPTSSTVALNEDACGRVYVVSLAGTVKRLVEPTNPASCSLPDPYPPETVATTSADATAPRLLTRTPRRQRVLRQKGLIAYTRCSNESCNLSMTARLRIGRLSYPLQRVRRTLGANRRVKVRAKLTARASRALRRALRSRTRARVDVAYRARDAAGNRSPLKRTKVRVRR